jgi:hypothetical protein
MDRADGRSLNDLQRETERTRAELAATVDQLRSKVTDTVTDFRDRASPDAMKAEIGGYLRAKADALMDTARENPLQAAAIGVGVGYPLLKIARSIPAPILMVGAGLYLLGSSSGQKLTETISKKVSGAVEGMSDSFGAGMDAANQKLHDTRDMADSGLAGAKDTIASGVEGSRQQAAAFGSSLSQLKDRAADLASSASDRVVNFAGSASDRVGKAAGSASDGVAGLKQRAVDAFAATSDAMGAGVAKTGSLVRDGASSAAEFGTNTGLKLRDQASDATEKVSAGIGEVIQRNPLLVGGLGLTIGMLIASALPKSDVEKNIMGSASAEAQKRASAFASQQLGAVKDLASGAIADIAEHAGKEGLAPADLNSAAEDIGRRVRKVAESASDAAFGYANEKTIDAHEGALDYNRSSL